MIIAPTSITKIIRNLLQRAALVSRPIILRLELEDRRRAARIKKLREGVVMRGRRSEREAPQRPGLSRRKQLSGSQQLLEQLALEGLHAWLRVRSRKSLGYLLVLKKPLCYPRGTSSP